MGTVLDVIGVDYEFRSGFWMRRKKVLSSVSLSVPENSVFGFLGANGAGKTSLIHLMTGLRKPSEGKVLVFGYEAQTAVARSKVGYLPERPYFHDHLTAEGVLKYYGALAGMSRAQVRERIPNILSIVGMDHAKNVELRHCSKGMLQRVGIAQAMIHHPEILILDEPMSGLDPIGRKEIRELIVHLASEGRTIFFSSHVIPDVESICDQVAWIQKGKVMGCGPIGSFLAQGPLRTEIAFSGPKLEQWSQFPEFISIRKNSEGLRGTVEGQVGVDRVLFQLMQEKAKILWVTPIRMSLEDLFTKSTEQQKEETYDKK